MNQLNYFDERRKKIFAKKGGWKVGKGVTSYGHSLFSELMGNISYSQMLLLNITGNLYESRVGKWLDAVAISVSYPDVRIWTNTIGALGGTARTSSTAGICAGLLASDSKIYGPGSSEPILRFMNILKTQYENEGRLSLNKILEKIKTNSKVFPINAPGFMKPLSKGDERVPVLLRIANDLGFSHGDYVVAALAFEEILNEQFGEQLNLSGYMAAFMLDLGLTKNQIQTLIAIIVNAGVHASYIEYLESPPESLLPLRCDDMEYVGPAIKVKPEHLDPP